MDLKNSIYKANLSKFRMILGHFLVTLQKIFNKITPMELPKYETSRGVYTPTAVQTIRRSDRLFQPLYEAITNSMESIAEHFNFDKLNHGAIKVKLYVKSNLFSKENKTYDFEKIEVIDNGKGFDNEGYRRLIDLRDNRKSKLNKGTGRVQFLHFFKNTTIDTVSNIGHQKYIHRKITLSKTADFELHNALVRLDAEEELTTGTSGTTICLLEPWEEKIGIKISEYDAISLKQEVLDHFMARFCDIRDKFYTIKIERYIDNELDDNGTITINAEDIPTPDKEFEYDIQYTQKSGRRLTKIDRKETFKLRSFLLSPERLHKNAMRLISKGEVCQDIELNIVQSKEIIDEKRFLFLLSSDYLDTNDDDARGSIHLMTEKELKQKEVSCFDEDVILIDDIESVTNQKINENYPQLNKLQEEKNRNLDEIQAMFLISPKTINNLRKKIKVSDSDEDILKLIYTQEISTMAQNDAKIKQHIRDIRTIDPNDSDYQDKLKSIVEDFTTLVPTQNRTAITKYVARRKLVLEVFDSLLHKYNNGEKLKENLFHNLFLKQREVNSRNSDLWLINEDYIYFNGLSECELGKAQVDGEMLFIQDMTEEQRTYREKMNKDAGQRRPDILLFPEEGKCLIIEFKAPDVNVALHLDQINRYAALIHNLCNEKFHFDTFYGYLIGENIDIDEIRDANSDYVTAQNLGYIYRPHYRVPGKFDRKDGALYTEIIKYSDILKRAQLRNKVFIDMLDDRFEV